MDNSFLSSIHIGFGDPVFNLSAVEGGEPVNLERAIHIAFWPDICAAILLDFIQASNLLFVPLKISMDARAACIMVCSIMMDGSKLPW